MKLGLCDGRHPLPCDKFIFESIEDIFDYKSLRETAIKVLSSDPDPEVDLYVTGLTTALVEVLTAGRICNKTIKLWHYDFANDTYYPQVLELWG